MLSAYIWVQSLEQLVLMHYCSNVWFLAGPYAGASERWSPARLRGGAGRVDGGAQYTRDEPPHPVAAHDPPGEAPHRGTGVGRDADLGSRSELPQAAAAEQTDRDRDPLRQAINQSSDFVCCVCVTYS